MLRPSWDLLCSGRRRRVWCGGVAQWEDQAREDVREKRCWRPPNFSEESLTRGWRRPPAPIVVRPAGIRISGRGGAEVVINGTYAEGEKSDCGLGLQKQFPMRLKTMPETMSSHSTRWRSEIRYRTFFPAVPVSIFCMEHHPPRWLTKAGTIQQSWQQFEQASKHPPAAEKNEREDRHHPHTLRHTLTPP